MAPTGAEVSVIARLAAAGVAEPEALLRLALPGARLRPCIEEIETGGDWASIRPAPFQVPRVSSTPKPRSVDARSSQSAYLLCPPPGSAVDWPRVLVILREFDVRLRLCLSTFLLDALTLVAIERARESLTAANLRPSDRSDEIGALLGFLRSLSTARRAIRLEAFVDFPGRPVPLAADLLCRAIFHRGVALESHEDREVPNLRGLSADGEGLPCPIPDAASLAAVQRQLATAVTKVSAGGLVLGEVAGGGRVILSANDRARHLYVIGATGTGKSTLLLNLIEQDVRNGQGIILLDPHGDLADDALDIAKRCGRKDLIFADASDPAGSYRTNILEGTGANPAATRNYVANGLIRLLRRVLYDGVPDAFGPMFELYFRNALMLMMCSGEPVTLADFESVFTDKARRYELLAKCEDSKIVQFWRDIAERVTYEEATLNNITPYITCKLAQFTGNPVLRNILCQSSDVLDLPSIMDNGRVLILKAAKGALGQTDTEILAAVTLMRIAQAGMARATRPREDRRPVRLYIDEFQTCAGDSLGDILVEARKFGLSLVLANQSLRQIDGRRSRPDVGEAALANAANLVALRVGAPDAASLAPWFEGDARDLCHLPDFHASARVLQNGQPLTVPRLRVLPRTSHSAKSRSRPANLSLRTCLGPVAL